jgi:hypothetical protein
VQCLSPAAISSDDVNFTLRGYQQLMPSVVPMTAANVTGRHIAHKENSTRSKWQARKIDWQQPTSIVYHRGQSNGRRSPALIYLRDFIGRHSGLSFSVAF